MKYMPKIHSAKSILALCTIHTVELGQLVPPNNVIVVDINSEKKIMMPNPKNHKSNETNVLELQLG